MSHADLTAQEILADLPDEIASTLQTLAVQRKVPMTALLKEGLVNLARDIVANNPPTRPPRYRPASAA